MRIDLLMLVSGWIVWMNGLIAMFYNHGSANILFVCTVPLWLISLFIPKTWEWPSKLDAPSDDPTLPKSASSEGEVKKCLRCQSLTGNNRICLDSCQCDCHEGGGVT